MLNNPKITVESGVTRKVILADAQNFYSLPIKVTSVGAVTLKAGTPLTGSLLDRNTAFTQEVTNAGTSNAVGMLMQEVTIPAGGTVNAAILVQGVVDQSALDDTVVTLLTAAVKTALKHIIFMK